MKNITLFVFALFISTQLAAQVFFSAETLFSKDRSIQFPVGQSAFSNYSSGSTAIGFNIGIALSKNISIESGFRRKNHFIVLETNWTIANRGIETSHGIPVLVSYSVPLGKKRYLSRLHLSISGGVLFDIMNKSGALPLVRENFAYAQMGPNNTVIYTGTESFDKKDINQVSHSVCLNGKLSLSVKVFKFLDLFAGFGYTEGFKDLAKGSYTFTSASSFQSGTTIQKGDYKYWVTGLTYRFQKKE